MVGRLRIVLAHNLIRIFYRFSIGSCNQLDKVITENNPIKKYLWSKLLPTLLKLEAEKPHSLPTRQNAQITT